MNGRDLWGDWVVFGCFFCAGCLSVFVVCPSYLCLSVVLWGQPTSVSRQQQVSMEQQAGQQMVQRQRGRVTSVSIRLSPVAPSATDACCHQCRMQAQVLHACPSLGAWQAQGLHQQGGMSSSEMSPQQLEMEGIQLFCVVWEGSGSQELSSTCGDTGKL